MTTYFFVFDIDSDLSRARRLTAPDDITVTAAPPIADYRTMVDRSDEQIRIWIDAQLAATSCLVVLIGQHTANQRWVKYAIGMARQLELPMIGVAIDKLTDDHGNQGVTGPNPFANAGMSARTLSALEIYDPPFATSSFARAHIRYSLPDWVETAIRENRWRQESRTRRQERRADNERHEAS
jgi:hypothetical protein